MRFTLPPALLFATALYALPRTTANVRSEVWDLETTHVPAFARVHATAYDHSLMALDRAREGTRAIRAKFDTGAKELGGFVQEKSGVKLRDLAPIQVEGRTQPGNVERIEKAVDVPGKGDSVNKVL